MRLNCSLFDLLIVVVAIAAVVAVVDFEEFVQLLYLLHFERLDYQVNCQPVGLINSVQVLL